MNYPYGAPAGPVSNPPNDRKQIIIVLAVVAALLLTFLGIGAVYLTSGSSKVKASPAPELVLEAMNSNGLDPFAPSVAVSNRPLDANARNLAPQGPVTPRGVQAVEGTTAGLYGGTGEASCDTAALANFLANNPGKAAAWASVFGIGVDQIPYYLDTLTPVVLTHDTWVTNYSYENGVATPFQSVLQAGTAVLVDSYGIPRVRCACGNPLSPPAGTPLSGYRTVGSPWDYYAPRQVVYVNYHNEHTTIINNTTTVVAAPNPAPAPASLTLLDLNTLQPVLRTVGGILNLAGLPPLQGALPTPASLNTPFVSPDPEVQTANGVQADGQPAENVLRQAAEATDSETSSVAAAESAGPQEGSPSVDASAQAPVDPSVPAAPGESSAAQAPPAPAAPAAPTSAAPTPTVFTGTGDIVSSLTFTVDGTQVSCSVPDVTAPTAGLICTDGIARTVSSSYLQTSSVTSGTDAAGVWTVPLTSSAGVERVTVLSATWTLIPTPTVEAPAPAPAPATETAPTETATTAPETTTETTAPTSDTSAPAVP
ncbi:DUF6777 domain-containing protein [Williamsia sp. 1135]|uniref:DUF6777 domain-containing protein n=1 Tax=Williamsia sp. 1135 TaxID=1889262 RepID=UPI000A119979|nr:DUF6777 domain-containing protein [Williamsia sp. 1135]ORM34398.1 hypothetical protein BFL43_11790 [Williamsia sp. 1135]